MKDDIRKYSDEAILSKKFRDAYPAWVEENENARNQRVLANNTTVSTRKISQVLNPENSAKINFEEAAELFVYMGRPELLTEFVQESKSDLGKALRIAFSKEHVDGLKVDPEESKDFFMTVSRRVLKLPDDLVRLYRAIYWMTGYIMGILSAFGFIFLVFRENFIELAKILSE